jgi:hypothetical protein
MGEYCCSGCGFGGRFAPAVVVCYCRLGGCCLTVCSGGFWWFLVLRMGGFVAPAAVLVRGGSVL